MKHSLYVLLISLASISCNETKGPSDKEKGIIADSIRQTLQNYLKDVKTSGLTAEFKYLDSSADFFWVPPGYSSAINYDSVSKILRQNAPDFKSIDNRYDTLKIIVLSKRLATYTAKIHSTSVDTGGKVYEADLIETGVVIKRAKGWKFQSGQTSVLN